MTRWLQAARGDYSPRTKLTKPTKPNSGSQTLVEHSTESRVLSVLSVLSEGEGGTFQNEGTAAPPADPPKVAANPPGRQRFAVNGKPRPGVDGWTGEDWRAFFDERAGLAEFEGGLPRDQAEARAFAACVTEWLNRTPPRAPPDRCPWCGEAKQGRDLLLLLGTEPTCQAWLHARCWPAWHASRKAEAVAALATFEIHEKRTSP